MIPALIGGYLLRLEFDGVMTSSRIANGRGIK